MTYKEKMEAVLTGKPTDGIPIIPRLDLWYKANKYNGTLPTKYKNATLMQIIDDLNVGYHTVSADRDVYDDSTDIVDRALGYWRVHSVPYKACLRNVNRNISYNGETCTVEYLTPYGNIRTRTVYNESMRKAGITLSHVSEHAIKSHEDYKAIGYIFENFEVLPNYEDMHKMIDEVGDRAIVVGTANQGASAMHHILHELIPYDLFFTEYYDHYDELVELSRQMKPFFDKIIDVCANSPVQILQAGTNFDSQITWAPFFEQHIVPALIETADKLHAKGKYLLNHTDGENKGLLQYYPKTKMDIADSICPSPMTSHTLKEIRDEFNGKITIWGGIPSVSVLENSMSDYDFEKYIDDLFIQMGKGDHLILSISDTAPPQMKFDRLEKLIKKANEFGQVKP